MLTQKNIKATIEYIINQKLDSNNFRFSDYIDLALDGTIVVMDITKKVTVTTKNKQGHIQKCNKDITELNMQQPAACFEGWAAVLKAYVLDGINYTGVRLRCNSIILQHGLSNDRHVNRFLYRVLRFYEQYAWFSVDTSLGRVMVLFKEYLTSNAGMLVNNYPDKPNAPTNNSSTGNNLSLNEYAVECHLAASPANNNSALPVTLHSYFNSMGIGNQNLVIDHQLPVGLFGNNTISRKESIFTIGKSAIDLWAVTKTKPNDFYLFELKYNNPMLGIITEAFFYANYMYDLLDKNGTFTLSDDGGQNNRSYSTIYGFKNKEINRIHAIMLADTGNMHPAITQTLVAVLNKSNHKAIEYEIAEYELQNGAVTYINKI